MCYYELINISEEFLSKSRDQYGPELWNNLALMFPHDIFVFKHKNILFIQKVITVTLWFIHACNILW